MIGNRNTETLGVNRNEVKASHKITPMEVALLTGGGDKPYAFGMALALTSEGILLDVIGSNEIDSPHLHRIPGLTFLNFWGNRQPGRHLPTKVIRVLVYYVRLIRYTATARPKVFHILWNNKFEFFDRTLLMLYYRIRGKRIVFTAHNVNVGKRDSNDSWVNRATLRIQYALADHIFVHTESMKTELVRDFVVPATAVTVIPFGLNNSVPDTDLTTLQAKERLGIEKSEKTILFFGGIRPYKGLEYLVEAFQRLVSVNPEYRLIIAGALDKGTGKYWEEIERTINSSPHRDRIIQRIQFIPDTETELYFKAADLLALPYTHVFQSGVLFTAYTFGLPVVAADVGSLREDLVEGQTGFMCRPRDSSALLNAIERYFDSDLFRNLDRRRPEIRKYAKERHSWKVVGDVTRLIYASLSADNNRKTIRG